MVLLSDIIVEKDNIEYKISNLLSDYYIKYYKKLYYYIYEALSKRNSNKIERTFQKELLKITKWTDEKQKKEYKKFLTWCYQKKGINDKDIIQNLLETYMKLSLKVMLYPNYTENRYLFENDTPKARHFFYLCLKRIGRYYYDNTLKIKSDENLLRSKLKELIVLCLIKYLPFSDICNKIQENDAISNASDINKLDDELEQLIPEYKLLVEKNQTEGGDDDENIVRKDNIVILPSEISETEDEEDKNSKMVENENNIRSDINGSEEERHIFIKSNKIAYNDNIGMAVDKKRQTDFFTE
jgi:hypothetical protein